MKETNTALKEYIAKAIDYFDMPGVAVGIKISKESPLASAGLDEEYSFGFPNNEVFHFASVSKLFVATAIMQLAGAGKLELNGKLTDYLPKFKMADERYKEITIKQMLSHTAGMPDVHDYHWDDPKMDSDALKNYVYSKEVAEGHLLHEPGEPTFIYSNMAYETLGALISELSKVPFEQYIADNIFIPLGMRDSTFLTFLRDAQKCKLASPHYKDAEKHTREFNVYPYNREHAPSSTLTSTIMDIKKFGDSHMKDVWEPIAEIPNVKEQIGLGWFIREQEGYTLYGHEGSDDGFRSSFWICPELELQIIVLSNLDKAPVKKMNKRLFEILIKDI